MLGLEELIVELGLGVLQYVEDARVLHLHRSVASPVLHILALDDKGVIVHREAHPTQLPGAILDAGKEAGRVREQPYLRNPPRLSTSLLHNSSFNILTNPPQIQHTYCIMNRKRFTYNKPKINSTKLRGQDHI